MDNIDVNYAREKEIFVFNTPASSSQSVAELVIGLCFEHQGLLEVHTEILNLVISTNLKKNMVQVLNCGEKHWGLLVLEELDKL